MDGTFATLCASQAILDRVRQLNRQIDHPSRMLCDRAVEHEGMIRHISHERQQIHELVARNAAIAGYSQDRLLNVRPIIQQDEHPVELLLAVERTAAHNTLRRSGGLQLESSEDKNWIAGAQKSENMHIEHCAFQQNGHRQSVNWRDYLNVP